MFGFILMPLFSFNNIATDSAIICDFTNIQHTMVVIWHKRCERMDQSDFDVLFLRFARKVNLAFARVHTDVSLALE